MVGGAGGAALTRGKFKPVPKVLKKMDKKKRQALFQHLKSILQSLDVDDVRQLRQAVDGDPAVKNEVIEGIKSGLAKIVDRNVLSQ